MNNLILATKIIALWLVGVFIVFCVTVAIIPVAAPQEYTVLITRAAPPAQIMERIQVGLNKAQAEGVAFQLNEMFSREKSEWRAVAVVQQDVSTLPREIKP